MVMDDGKDLGVEDFWMRQLQASINANDSCERNCASKTASIVVIHNWCLFARTKDFGHECEAQVSKIVSARQKIPVMLCMYSHEC